MRSHLAALEGSSIPTITGHRNRIVGIEGDSVIVATSKSPAGAPVPLIEIQDAVNRVFDGEEVRLDPLSVGYRSAFVGAVLKSIPGVEVLRYPSRARLVDGAAKPRNEVEAFLRRCQEPLRDRISSDRRFHVLATPPGSVTYRRFNSSEAPKTISTEALQAILTEVQERDRTAEGFFHVGVEPRFWTDHGYFANAVIAAIAPKRFNDSLFDGLVPDEAASLGSYPRTEPVDEQEIPVPEPEATEPDSKPVGVPYVAANETASVAERDPFPTDPDLIERGTRSHARLQNQLAAEVAAAGSVPLSPIDSGPRYDLAWWDDADLHVAEIKSTTPANEEHQLRMGLGQLLRYRHALSTDGMTVHATLYVEQQPADPAWSDLCRTLQVTLRWPMP